MFKAFKSVFVFILIVGCRHSQDRPISKISKKVQFELAPPIRYLFIELQSAMILLHFYFLLDNLNSLKCITKKFQSLNDTCSILQKINQNKEDES